MVTDRRLTSDPVTHSINKHPLRREQEFSEIRSLDDSSAIEGVEEIARFVPPECFYLRFGSFGNFLWFQKLAQEHGGDVMRMAALPSLDFRTGPRVEELLNVKYTKLADLFGDKLIADVAVVGNDLHMKEGPSIGVLLRARNAFLLSTFMEQDRAATANSVKDCSLQSQNILGIETSFLSTPDNRIRSFWIKNGDWFFVTSSRSLAQRFIQARKDRKTLAATQEFQHYRTRYPSESKNPAITLFFSTQFLSSLYHPEYQISLLRRSRSLAEIGCASVATRCSIAEGHQSHDLESLRQNGFLAEGFGQRSDGSRLIETVGLGFEDSDLGSRLSMLPITDTTIGTISSNEELWLDFVDRSADERVEKLRPLFARIRRSEDDMPERDLLKITVDAPSSVLGKYAWLANELGSPTDLGAVHPSDDLAHFSANIQSSRFDLPQHLLFGGVKDCSPIPFRQFDTTLDKLFGIPSVRGYLGAWPDPGLIDRLPLGLGRGSQVGPNMTRLIGGAYRFQSDKVSLLSFQREVLNDSIPKLAIKDNLPPTSARIAISDLTSTQLGDWINQTLLLEPSKRTAGTCGYLDQISQQLKSQPDRGNINRQEHSWSRDNVCLGWET